MTYFTYWQLGYLNKQILHKKEIKVRKKVMKNSYLGVCFYMKTQYGTFVLLLAMLQPCLAASQPPRLLEAVG